ncbi:hypothetical protein LMG28727_07162 [Paraburkholderia kirstenboschensis]|nr:hypothetical protein LMG28727_07162 [Paraburkholderia kirstenboschensis]
MSKFAKLLKFVVSATKRPELPEDHTRSQASMAAQRRHGPRPKQICRTR